MGISEKRPSMDLGPLALLDRALDADVPLVGAAALLILMIAGGCQSRDLNGGKRADGGGSGMPAMDAGRAEAGEVGQTATGGTSLGSAAAAASGGGTGTAGAGAVIGGTGTGSAGAAGGGTATGGAAGAAALGMGIAISVPPLSFVQLPDLEDYLEYLYPGSRFSSVDLADVNGDGVLDVVAGQLGIDPNAVVMLGNGDGSFGASRGIESIGVTSAVLIGDLNDDHKPDLLVSLVSATIPSPGMTFALNRGDGTYGALVTLDAPAARRGLASTTTQLVDLNGDGMIDIAALQASSVNVSLGTGSGTFAPFVAYLHNLNVPTPLPTSQPRAIGRCLAAGDLNGDGRPDLAVTLENRFVSILLNHGDGTFGPPTFFSTEKLPDTVLIADLNGDATGDLVLGQEPGLGSTPTTLSTFLNSSGAVFAPPTTYNVADSIDIRLVDFNGDGKVDLVTDGRDVRLNKGGGVFAAPVTLPMPATGPTAALGDVNGDGKTDVVIGAFRHVHVFLNTSP